MEHAIYEDPLQCRRIWNMAWPVSSLFDLWEVRSCFHDVYQKPLQFHVIREKGRIAGFLPLTLNEDTGQYVCFPGETWNGKTWLEQNRIIAERDDILQSLLDHVPGPLHLRYLSWHPLLSDLETAGPDEMGYLFYPGIHNYDFENYWLGFSGKTRKKLKAELKKFDTRKISFRFNEKKDLEKMFQMNRLVFSQQSYFDDHRFTGSFDRLAALLSDMGMLRIVTILIGGTVAAVDMGGVFKNTCTMFAGGTDPEFPGIAKLINLHHMEWACQKQLESVDFLCGDFNWKERFHLSPRPLFEIKREKDIHSFSERIHGKRAVYA